MFYISKYYRFTTAYNDIQTLSYVKPKMLLQTEFLIF